MRPAATLAEPIDLSDLGVGWRPQPASGVVIAHGSFQAPRSTGASTASQSAQLPLDPLRMNPPAPINPLVNGNTGLVPMNPVPIEQQTSRLSTGSTYSVQLPGCPWTWSHSSPDRNRSSSAHFSHDGSPMPLSNNRRGSDEETERGRPLYRSQPPSPFEDDEDIYDP